MLLSLFLMAVYDLLYVSNKFPLEKKKVSLDFFQEIFHIMCCNFMGEQDWKASVQQQCIKRSHIVCFLVKFTTLMAIEGILFSIVFSACH